MARMMDDPTVGFDSGVFFDGYTPAARAERQTMAEVKLTVSDMNPMARVRMAETLIARMTDNPSFPRPNPSLAEMDAQRTRLRAELNKAEELRQAAIRQTGVVNVEAEKLGRMLTAQGVYIQEASGGVREVILSSGVDVRAERTPTSELPRVQNLSLWAGGEQGEISARWDPVPRAKFYEFQTSPSAQTDVWNPQGASSASKTTIKGLTSGCRIWVRVRAKGGNDVTGAWSDPAVKIVP